MQIMEEVSSFFLAFLFDAPTNSFAFSLIYYVELGYSYRLCKKVAGQKETEECYQNMPLDFASDTTVITFYDGSRDPFAIPATTTSVGTWPIGSQWRKNPIPMCGCDIGDFCESPKQSGKVAASVRRVLESSGKHCVEVSKDMRDIGVKPAFRAGPSPLMIASYAALEPRKKRTVSTHGVNPTVFTIYTCSNNNPRACYTVPYSKTYFRPGQKSDLCPTGLMFPSPFDEGEGGGVGGSFQFTMTDKLRVPNLEPGDYSLSFRWDCEQTPQVWNSCADIRVVT